MSKINSVNINNNDLVISYIYNQSTIKCSTGPNINPSFPNGNFGKNLEQHFPSSSDLKTNFNDRLKTNYIKNTPEEVGVNIYEQISTIDLAKTWILATHGLSKTWDNGEKVDGGFPTCSRAISTSTAESGGNAPKTNSYDAGFYGGTGGCGDPEGGCWQTSNPQLEICKYTANPFCGALQAWGHKTGPGGISPTSCDNSDNKDASSCTVSQLTTNGINPGCHLGALCYGHTQSGWNSPPRAAMFRMCSEGTDDIPYSNTIPGACDPYKNVKTSCEIAQCSCKIALEELKEKYKDISFIETINDKGYDEFKKACSLGRSYNPNNN